MPKPAEQTSSTGTNGAGDAVSTAIDLESDLGNEGDNNEGEGDDNDANNGGTGTGLPDPSDTSVDAVVARALAAQEARLASEFDRRVNQAVDKVKRKLGKSTDPDDDEDEEDDDDRGGRSGRSKQKASAPVGATKAEVSGARRAFRDSLGDHIKIIGQEERDLVNDLGFAMIGSAARKPIEDEYDLGEEVAEKVAGIIRKTRDFYSQRTRAVLTRQGAIRPQDAGQSSNPGAGLDDHATAQAKALAKDRELNPGRYNADGTRK